MKKIGIGLLTASVALGIVGCGGSSGGGNTVSDGTTRSITGTWTAETSDSVSCIETWVFGSGYTVNSLNYDAEGTFSFATSENTDGRHALALTETTNDGEQECTDSPYGDDLPGDGTFYLEYSGVDAFDVYTSSSGGTSVGAFTRT